MKVALSFPGCHRRGGVERVVFECAGFLAQRQHEVTVFAEEWEEDDQRGVHYHRVVARRHPAFLRGSSYFHESTAALARQGFDVLNTHGAVCPTGGVHWVQSVHRAWLERCREFRPPFSPARIRQRLNPLHPVILKLEETHFRERRYRKVIATTEQVRADLQRFYDVPPSDVEVIPNGFSPVEFSPERRAERRPGMREKLGLKPDDIALLFVANELDRKGFETVLGALKILDSPRLQLLAIGKPSVATIQKSAQRFGVAGQVKACGPTSDVAAYHAAGDLFVLPTQYEAFSLAILESLGSGVPVITTNVPGARDAIRPGENGWLLQDPKSAEELAAALSPLLDNARREALSATTPATAAQYRWPNVLERYEQLLSKHCHGN
jgi:UDP-glucose:(heptosyl)LPS alpha-1,3-glucosyltransferase